MRARAERSNVTRVAASTRQDAVLICRACEEKKSRRRESLCLRAARASRELIRQFARAERTPCAGPGGASVSYSDKRRVSERSCKKYTSPTRLTSLASPARAHTQPQQHTAAPHRRLYSLHPRYTLHRHTGYISPRRRSPTRVPSPFTHAHRHKL